MEVEIGPMVWSTKAGPLVLRFFRCTWLPAQRPRALGSVQFRWVRREDLAGLSFPPADRDLIGAIVAGRV